MSALIGRRTSVNTLAANQKPSIDSTLKTLMPYQTPIMQYLFFSGKNSKPVTNATGKFSWMEDVLFPHYTTLKTNVTAGIMTPKELVLNSTTCTDFSIFKLYDIVFLDETGQQALVTARDATSTTLQCIDMATDLTNLTSAAAAQLRIIGSANPEVSVLPTAMSTVEAEKYNYLTKFEELVSSSGRDQAAEHYTDGVSHAEQVKKKMIEMKAQFERNFIYSKVCGSVTVGTGKVSYGKGIFGLVTTNVSASYTTITKALFDAHLKACFAKGSNKRQFHAGSDLFTALQATFEGKQTAMTSKLTEYGTRVINYMHSLGEVEITWNPMLEGKYSTYGLTIDPSKFTPRHMANDQKGSRKFRIEANVEVKGTDGTDTKLLADIGLQVDNEETCGILVK